MKNITFFWLYFHVLTELTEIEQFPAP